MYAFIEKKLQDIEAATSVLVPHLQKHIAHRVLHAHHVVSQLHEIVRGCQALLQKVLLVEPLDDNALLVIEVLHQLTGLPPHQHRHLLDIGFTDLIEQQREKQVLAAGRCHQVLSLVSSISGFPSNYHGPDILRLRDPLVRDQIQGAELPV